MHPHTGASSTGPDTLNRSPVIRADVLFSGAHSGWYIQVDQLDGSSALHWSELNCTHVIVFLSPNGLQKMTFCVKCNQIILQRTVHPAKVTKCMRYLFVPEP